MSPNAPIEVHITSRPPSPDALPPYHLDLQYPASASSSESNSPPPDSPTDRDYCAPAPLDMKLVAQQHPHWQRVSDTASNDSSSPTDSECFSRTGHDAPHVHTVPVIPTLLPMPSLAAGPSSMSASSSESDAAKSRPEDDHHFPSSHSQAGPSRTRTKAASMSLSPSLDQTTSFDPAHPYARLYTRKEGAKRRKMWNHALEKSLFTPQEISTMGAPNRRTIYIASLEAHTDRLHAQLLNYALFPVPFEKLENFRGLNTKTAKSMVAGLYRDAAELRMKRLELERAMHSLRGELFAPPAGPPAYPHPQVHYTACGTRRHSLD
ncbi:hypothetical protein DAEQUDRAFT_761137 [Daedalea quercina L-15889]|uniref:Uncharacterized protein n=1 Tax=Daedalea quercina L-15889 TaxID=1314783 RepID=A0A165UNP7_9APHY|nr:hypothetical protein DAEQUDRAFT_761137 [Daedalea quercina L-15889]